MVKLNEKQRFIALAVAVVLLFGGLFASVAMDIAQSRAINNLQTKLYDDDATANNIHAEEFVTEMASTSKVSLAAVTPMRMAVNPRSGAATAAVNYVTQTIKATVFPENASNVKVDWSIAWESSSQTANIASYIEVVPVTEGGLTANVNCYRALPGNAVITVTTRDGGHQATCTVKFVGIPSSMEVTHASLTQGTGGSYIVPMFQRQTYNFDINLNNIFNSVGTSYKNFSVVSVTPYGNIMAGSYCDYGDGTDDWSSIVKTPLSTYKSDFTATISGSTLKVNMPNVGYLYSNYSETSSETMYDDYFYSTVTGEECGVIVTVKNTSGLTATVKLVFDATSVVDVNLDQSTITF